MRVVLNGKYLLVAQMIKIIFFLHLKEKQQHKTLAIGPD